jgi:hypothetical protein
MPPLRRLLLVALLTLGGCQPHRPSFLSRVREDCASGDQWACDLLDTLAHPKSTPPVSPPDAGGDGSAHSSPAAYGRWDRSTWEGSVLV